MNISATIPFQNINWPSIEKEVHTGETGFASWQTFQLPGLRIRIVEYSAGYIADHWCKRGHIVHCLQGTLTSELKNGEVFILSNGMTYVVSDNTSFHRSVTTEPVRLLIIDGEFLNRR
jgi:quercetin dioxygenase-like cupin family protein